MQPPDALSLQSEQGVPPNTAPFVAESARLLSPNVVALAAWHSLAWLVFANAIGVLLAGLLLFPSGSALLGEFSYGRWMPVHINVQLFGWSSLPLVGFLFRAYGTEHGHAAMWPRSVLWIWSSALAAGALSWLTGHSSGKLFLDWVGLSRVLFPLALASLWLLLAVSFRTEWRADRGSRSAAQLGKLLGLILLFAVPFLIYIAANPNLYPPINPDSGGPTGASQLESVLIVIAILLLLPLGLTRLKGPTSWRIKLPWILLIAESLLCLALGRADVSHHRPVQYVSLASLLVWLPLTPVYYKAFVWHANTRRWRIAFLCWWSVLIPTGWLLFLPGVLDHFKFTDGLVGHSLLAMGGFVSSLLIFVMIQLLGEDGWIFNGTSAFYVWQLSVVAYVAAMFTAGWQEGFNPAFTMAPASARNVIYSVRLILGILMFLASADWLLNASKLLRQPPASAPFRFKERIA